MTKLPALHFTISETHNHTLAHSHRWPQAEFFPKKAAGRYFAVDNPYRLPSAVIIYLLNRSLNSRAKARLH